MTDPLPGLILCDTHAGLGQGPSLHRSQVPRYTTARKGHCLDRPSPGEEGQAGAGDLARSPGKLAIISLVGSGQR